jgi:hypothetical protein
MMMYNVTAKDYSIVENENSPLSGVLLKTGTWKDVMVVYGQVGIKEDPNLDMATLSFNYTVQDPAEFSIEELDKDESFKNYLGAILQYIVTDSLEYAKDTNQDIIGKADDKSTTNSHTKSSS